MRLVTGGAPGASLAEIWGALRDEPIDPCKAYAEQVALAHAKVDYVAPSRAHRTRIMRPRPEVNVGHVPPLPGHKLTTDLEFLQSQRHILRDMGVLRVETIPPPLVIDRPHAPIPEPHRHMDKETLRAKRAECREREARFLAGYGMDAAVRAWRMYVRA